MAWFAPLEVQAVSDGKRGCRDRSRCGDPAGSGPARSGPIGAGPLRPDLLRSGPSRPRPFRSGLVRTGPFRSGPTLSSDPLRSDRPAQARSGPACADPLRSSPTRPAQASSGPARADPLRSSRLTRPTRARFDSTPPALADFGSAHLGPARPGPLWPASAPAQLARAHIGPAHFGRPGPLWPTSVRPTSVQPGRPALARFGPARLARAHIGPTRFGPTRPALADLGPAHLCRPTPLCPILSNLWILSLFSVFSLALVGLACCGVHRRIEPVLMRPLRITCLAWHRVALLSCLLSLVSCPRSLSASQAALRGIRDLPAMGDAPIRIAGLSLLPVLRYRDAALLSCCGALALRRCGAAALRCCGASRSPRCSGGRRAPTATATDPPPDRDARSRSLCRGSRPVVGVPHAHRAA
ncbi:hypothetical protein SAMN05216298_1176 [Glycomyces sambucus]|uniref:Uncharacterized protein n=1 Tax=Glycomyces sambucus TaxID=380244 RepID=A0A1G9DY21_9ACTN|nr:hypothetical protein SAMN05216298_1176 [Glycomyces sambucus]